MDTPISSTVITVIAIVVIVILILTTMIIYDYYPVIVLNRSHSDFRFRPFQHDPSQASAAGRSCPRLAGQDVGCVSWVPLLGSLVSKAGRKKIRSGVEYNIQGLRAAESA